MSPDRERRGRGSWRGPALTAGVVVAAAGLVLAPALLMAAVLTGAGSGGSGGVCGDTATAAGDSLSSEELSEGQLRNAATVVAVGRQMRIPRQGIVVALAVASQESRFQNYANDGQGGDLGPTRRVSRARWSCRTRRWAPITARSVSSSSSGRGGARCPS